MSVKDIFLLIAGAVLGILLPFVCRKTVDWYWSLLKEIRKKTYRGKSLYNWLIEYYNNVGGCDELYRCKIRQYDIPLPFLTKKEWKMNIPLNINRKDDFLCLEEAREPYSAVNKKNIKRHKKMGQRIFNAATLYLDYMEELNMEPFIKLHVKVCDFYTAFSNLSKVEEETYRAILWQKKRKLKVRDNYYQTIDIAKLCRLKPNVACACTTVFQTKDITEILLTKRSTETIAFGGAVAVVPTFGLVPVRYGNDDLEFSNLLFFNFLKEYLEELFSYDELIEEIRNNKGDPFWFYNLDEARDFIECYNKGDVELKITGFGFDTSNGGAFISMMALIKNTTYIKKIKKGMHLNWESGVENANESIYDIININSPKIEEWLINNDYHYGCAFSLFRALECLK